MESIQTISNVLSEKLTTLAGFGISSLITLLCIGLVLITGWVINTVVTTKSKSSWKLAIQPLQLIATYLLSFVILIIANYWGNWNFTITDILITTLIIWLIAQVVYFIIHALIIIPCILVFSCRKHENVKKGRKKIKSVEHTENPVVNNELSEYTRIWVQSKLREEKTLTRLEILQKYKKDYINGLVNVIKSSTNFSNTINAESLAQKTFETYSNLWK